MSYLVNFRNQDASALLSMYKGAACFLVCGGPSLTEEDGRLLQRRGALIAAVNNAAAIVRPQLWIAIDSQAKFSIDIFRDPGIKKFVREDRLGHRLAEWDGKLGQYVEIDLLARDCPDVWGFKVDRRWSPKTFFSSTVPTDGTESKETDPSGTHYHRSVLLYSVRLLYDLGVRRIYLLGADFTMRAERPYAFDETVDDAQVESNGRLFRWLAERFAELREPMKAARLKIYNATRGGELEVFPRVTLEEALSKETGSFASVLRTRGYYRNA